jgi:hypothetical protein
MRQAPALPNRDARSSDLPGTQSGTVREASKNLFFEKKKQKTSFGCRGLSVRRRVKKPEVFFKKHSRLLSAATCLGAGLVTPPGRKIA